jgi:hypothetical protein
MCVISSLINNNNNNNNIFVQNPRGQILITLILMRAKYGENRADLFLEKHGHKEESEEKLSKKLTGATQVLSVVSVLIATVTFASAFTLPGGNRSDDAAAGSSSAGTPLFAGTYAFDAFILADVIAFICSSLATFSLLYAGMPSVDLPSRFWYINVAALLLMNSARTLVVAFALGLYVVLLPVPRRDAIIVCAITLASLLLGHKELRRMLFAAKMVWARYGTGRIPLFHVFLALLLVLAHFWSFLIIFGVPAIRNRK